MPFEAILFDCDGVLVDSELITNSVLHAMLNEAGWVLSEDDCMRTFVAKPCAAKRGPHRGANRQALDRCLDGRVL